MAQNYNPKNCDIKSVLEISPIEIHFATEHAQGGNAHLWLIFLSKTWI